MIPGRLSLRRLILRAKILEIVNETNRLNKESRDFATLRDFAASTRGEHGALMKTVSALRGTQHDYEAVSFIAYCVAFIHIFVLTKFKDAHCFISNGSYWSRSQGESPMTIFERRLTSSNNKAES